MAVTVKLALSQRCMLQFRDVSEEHVCHILRIETQFYVTGIERAEATT